MVARLPRWRVVELAARRLLAFAARTSGSSQLEALRQAEGQEVEAARMLAVATAAGIARWSCQRRGRYLRYISVQSDGSYEVRECELSPYRPWRWRVWRGESECPCCGGPR